MGGRADERGGSDQRAGVKMAVEANLQVSSLCAANAALGSLGCEMSIRAIVAVLVARSVVKK